MQYRYEIDYAYPYTQCNGAGIIIRRPIDVLPSCPTAIELIDSSMATCHSMLHIIHSGSYLDII